MEIRRKSRQRKRKEERYQRSDRKNCGENVLQSGERQTRSQRKTPEG